MKIKERNISWKGVIGWLLAGISMIMLLKSVVLCFCNDIWYDELFTVGMIKHSYGELVAFTARDVHPPLYYCITKFVVDLCKLIIPTASTVILTKVVSVLPYFILAAYSLTFLRKRFGIFTGGFFLFAVLAMPQLSAYTVEIRMYSWAMLFVTAALLHGYGTLTAQGIKGQRLHAAALVLYGLAAAYTQYFACVAVVMVYLYVLVALCCTKKERIREWFLWVIISILGYIPWLHSLIAQVTAVNDNYWILPLTWRSLGGCVKFLLKPSFTNEKINTVFAVALFVIYAVVVGLCAWRVWKHKEKEVSRFYLAVAGLMTLVGLVAFGFAASMLVRPIFVYRYMLSAIGGFWLCFALCLDKVLGMEKETELVNGTPLDSKLCKPMERKAWLLFANQLLVVVFLVVIGLRDYRAFLGEEEYKALLMQDTEEALSRIQPGDVVFYNFDQVQAVTSYYIDGQAASYLWGDTSETLIQEILEPEIPFGTLEPVREVAAETAATDEQNSSAAEENFATDAQNTLEEMDEQKILKKKTAQIDEWLREGKNVWFIGSFNSREEIVQQLEEAGFQVEKTGSYLLERYWFNLYYIK